MIKYVFVTGGVVSSLGKGIVVSSLGALAEAHGYKVSLQKIDPYLNIDPGTMSPYEHGEVYVTEDGAEADLDLGNYERFTHNSPNRFSSMTTGQVYDTVLKKERKGDYLGKTVQIIPHITDEIKRRIRSCALKNKADIAIIEVGGTVGDIESVPFLEAIRQMAREEKRSNTAYIHLTLAPYLSSADELKSKPTQHSVRELRALGISPDIIVCRSQNPLDKDLRRKISLFCDVDEKAVISAYNAPCSLYEMPEILLKEGLANILLETLGLPISHPELKEWQNITKIIHEREKSVKIAFVGKYVQHKDAYKSVYESLEHACLAEKVKLDLIKIDSEDFENDYENAISLLQEAQGLLVPGGFGERGVKGMVLAIQKARELDMPFFGICLGMQCMAIEFARNILNLPDTNSTEFKVEAENPIINLMEEQKALHDLGGTMRLGSFPAHLKKNSLAYKCYGKIEVNERHRHRYEFNNDYRQAFQKAGAFFSGINEEMDLVEVMELPDKKWFLGVQYHPEFKSKPFQAHPLFQGFIKASSEEIK